TIYKMPVAGSAAQPLATNVQGVWNKHSMVLSQANLYFFRVPPTDPNGWEIAQLSTNGPGDPTPFLPIDTDAASLVADGEALYVAVDRAQSILRISLDDATITPLAKETGAVQVYQLQLEGNTLFWKTGASSFRYTDKRP